MTLATAGIMLALTAIMAAYQPTPPVPSARAPQKDEAKPSDSTMVLVGRLVGGTWRTEGPMKAEIRYEWRIPGRAVRGVGAAAIGTPQEFGMEALYGWDPSAHRTYYFDFHGHDTVYKGWVEADGSTLKGDFECTVGEPGHYRFEAALSDDNTLLSTLFARNKAGEYVKMHTLTFKRHR